MSDGFTEEAITELGQLNPVRLDVIARTSSTAYKNTRKTTAEIGRELGVNYILEGSLRRAGDRVRINVRLIEVKGRTYIWTQDYDRELRDLLAVQGEVAQAIAHGIQLELTPPSAGPLASRRLVNQEAHEAYLRGRYFWNKRNAQGFAAAERYFQQAIEKDPAFALAYAGLADTYLLVGGYGYQPQAETIPQAKAAAQRALALDVTLSEPHASLGLMAMNYDWDWPEAERQFKLAIQLNPNYATAHHWYAQYLVAVGRFQEGFAQIRRAQELDPASFIIQYDAGVCFFLAREYDPAIAQLRKALEMEPNRGSHELVYTMIQRGRFEEALAEIRSWQRFDKSYLPPAVLGQTYVAMGKKAEALAAIEESRRRAKRGPVEPGYWALVYAQPGDKDRAFAILEQAYRTRSTAMTSLKVAPEYDPLRSDPPLY